MYIKLFEAFSIDDYQKAISKVKSMLVDKKPNDEILSYINTFYVDSAKALNKLRILSNRIVSDYLRHQKVISYNKRTRDVKKRKDGSDWTRGLNWKAGDVVTYSDYDYKRYYMVDDRYVSGASSFLESCESEYNVIIGQIPDSIDTKSIQFLFGRLFELMRWVIDTSPERLIIYKDYTSDDGKISKLEEFNKLDMENEVDEMSRLNRLIRREVTKSINGI